MSDKLQEDRPSIVPVSISEEMQRSFLDYSMSVIVSRALPDVRDGLKPVHRRILYTMHLLKNSPTGPYKKSARIVGDTMGRFHPHGDSAIYDALVRLSQPFSMRYPVVDGQGNFGSIDGDPPAAMRYTEVRMARLATEMLADIEKETVDFIPNYDDKEVEPSVLPTRFPCLLVNGASGIAVGMATNIPPHNMTEIVNALIALLKEPGLDVRDLLQHVHGPDFPTGGTILGRAGIVDAFRTGRGRITMRGRVEIEELKNDRQALIISEIPYQVNKAQLIERIADLVKEKVIDGISDIRDESDKDGIRVVVFVKREAVADIVLNNLYKHTQLQTNFSVNMIAIVDGRPRLLNLKDLLEKFLEHRRQVIIRRSEFELREAMEKREIIEGLGVASMDIDRVIELVRTSKDADEARGRLQSHDFTGLGAFLERAGFNAEEVARADAHYRLTERQAQAILDMRLQRLTGLQQEKLAGEYRQLTDQIRHLEALLASEELLRELMISELMEIREKYGDERKTEILEDSGDLDTEDLIEDVPLILTFTRSGYIKTMPVDMFRAQGRGGKGKRGAQLRDDDDVVTHILALTARSTVLFFTNTGRVFKEKAYCLPKSGPTSCGRPLVNFLRLQENERVVAMMPVPAIESGYYIFFATRRGVVKKTELMYYSNINQNGIIAVSIDDGDDLIDARLTSGGHDVLLATHTGLVARFPEIDVRPMGRAARGVRGIGLRGLDHVVSLAILDPDEHEKTVLSISERGFGKRSPAPDFSVHHRGGKGLLGIRTNERNGFLAAAKVVSEGDHLIALTEKGNLIRVAISQIRVISRLTMGFTIMKLPVDDAIRDITILPAEHIRPEEADEVTEVAGDGIGNGPEELLDEETGAPLEDGGGPDEAGDHAPAGGESDVDPPGPPENP